MGKYERIPTMEDEMVDKELQDLGVRFTDRTKEIPADAGYEPDVLTDAEIIKHNRRIRAERTATAACGMVVADSLLIFMCLADKIELVYGLVFLAAASAFFGGRVTNARL